MISPSCQYSHGKFIIYLSFNAYRLSFVFLEYFLSQSVATNFVQEERKKRVENFQDKLLITKTNIFAFLMSANPAKSLSANESHIYSETFERSLPSTEFAKCI